MEGESSGAEARQARCGGSEMGSGSCSCLASRKDKAAHPRGAAVTDMTGGDVASAMSMVTAW
jgi:hypothetical protein